MPDGAYVPSEAFKKASTADKIAFLSSKSQSFAKASPADQAAYINHLLGNDQQTSFERQNGMPDNERQANEFLLGAASGASGLPETLHPLSDAAKQQPQSIGEAAASGLKQAAFGPLPGIARKVYDVGSELLSPRSADESDEDVSERRSHALGTAAGNVLPMMAGDIKEGVNDSFAERPNVAAQRALRPAPKQAQSFQKSLPNAQAYLKGSSDLADLQSRIPGAKNEIWAPYQQALDNIGSQAVNGPDGPTTYADLEKSRLETSAQLQSFRKMLPVDQQGVIQKNQGIADLTKRYSDITGPLDDGLRSQGVDPEKIRSTFGDVQGINRLTQGRNTLSQADQPYGFGRMVKKASILHPLDSLGGVVEGTKDILAGRPLWNGKPTDVMVKEGFRSGPDKPDFGTPAPPTMPAVPIAPSDLPPSDSPTSFRTGISTPAAASYSPSPSQPNKNVIEMSPNVARPMPRTETVDGVKYPPVNATRDIRSMESQLVSSGRVPQEGIGAFRSKAMDLKDQMGDSRPWDDFYGDFLNRNTAIDVSPTLPPPTMPGVPKGTTANPDVQMPLRFRDNTTGIDHSVPADELDSAANALYGVEKYEHLTPEQKNGMLKFAQGPTPEQRAKSPFYQAIDNASFDKNSPYYNPSLDKTIDVTPSSSATLPPPTLPAIPSEGGVVAPPTGPTEGASLSPATKNAPPPFQASQLIRKPLVPPQQ